MKIYNHYLHKQPDAFMSQWLHYTQGNDKNQDRKPAWCCMW
jgi:hypothetical protein